MYFQAERLIQIRENMGITKAEAARRLNTTAMAYGRYEKAERTPSFQTVSYIAEIFDTTTDYLYGITDVMETDTITISAKKEPELFCLVDSMKKDQEMANRLLQYYEKISNFQK